MKAPASWDQKLYELAKENNNDKKVCLITIGLTSHLNIQRLKINQSTTKSFLKSSIKLKKIMFQKKIFGKNYLFKCEENLNSLLDKSLELYKDSKDKHPDVVIEISKKRKSYDVVSSNPKIYKKTRTGMLTDFGKVEAHWENNNGLLNIYVYLKYSDYGFKNYRKRIRSIEYSNKIETFEQILHELIIVPSSYFFENSVPIHAACLSIDNKAYLMAGTGGVGKSSALLSMRNIDNCEFISDDITILDTNHKVYGNMAWPKIYGYNCENNDVEDLILNNRSIVDKLHFYLKKRINPASVRRKISPDKLFNKFNSKGVELGRIFYLVREDVDEIIVKELSIEDAISMTLSVMRPEYNFFHQYINWEVYNSIIRKEEPLIDLNVVENKWAKNLYKIFSNTSCLKVSIPISMEHKNYQEQIKQLILSYSNE